MTSWKWLRSGNRRLDVPPQASETADEAQAGTLSELLHEHVQKGYERELDDNESMWRSLPLFALLMSFAGASLNFLATKAPAADRGTWAYIVYGLVIVNAAVFGVAVYHLWAIIRPQSHRYIANDLSVRNFALEMTEFYRVSGSPEAKADAAAAEDVRDYLIRELAEASSQIQSLNQKKAKARARALVWLGTGFLFWFFASTAILVDERIIQKKASDGTVRTAPAAQSQAGAGANGPAGTDAANSAAAAVRRGGSGSFPRSEPARLEPAAPNPAASDSKRAKADAKDQR